MSDQKYSMSVDEFADLEEAVAKTPQGRAFLREHARRNRTVGADDVARGLEEVKGLLTEHRGSEQIDILRSELEGMSASIAQTRNEISAIKPDGAGNNRIMAATEELDAIVTATERATTDILGHAEHLQELSGKLRDGGADAALCDELDNQLTEVFLACSFQDITGQRTTKVVNTLRYLEQRVNTMIEVWGTENNKRAGQALGARDAEGASSDESHLLEGPQLPGGGVDQEQIDEILDEPGPAEGEVVAQVEAAHEQSVSEGDLEALFNTGSDEAA